MKKWEKEGWNYKDYKNYKETFYLYTKATSNKLFFSIVENMDTLKSFFLSECFNGENQITSAQNTTEQVLRVDLTAKNVLYSLVT